VTADERTEFARLTAVAVLIRRASAAAGADGPAAWLAAASTVIEDAACHQRARLRTRYGQATWRLARFTIVVPLAITVGCAYLALALHLPRWGILIAILIGQIAAAAPTIPFARWLQRRYLNQALRPGWPEEQAELTESDQLADLVGRAREIVGEVVVARLGPWPMSGELLQIAYRNDPVLSRLCIGDAYLCGALHTEPQAVTA